MLSDIIVNIFVLFDRPDKFYHLRIYSLDARLPFVISRGLKEVFPLVVFNVYKSKMSTVHHPVMTTAHSFI